VIDASSATAVDSKVGQRTLDEAGYHTLIDKPGIRCSVDRPSLRQR
jgi:hypothetical protein